MLEVSMFDSMGAYNSWKPIQSISSFFYGIKSSPCRKCSHAKDDKNVCRLLKSCPINIPTLLPPEDKSITNRPKNPKNFCKFPGCKNMCAGEYCRIPPYHAQLVYTRKKRHPDNPEYWTLPNGANNVPLSKRSGNDLDR